MNEDSHVREHLQQLLDQAMMINGQITDLDGAIQRYENLVMGEGWSEGNIKVGWAKGDIFVGWMSSNLLNRDRIFSLSSITSQASLRLSSIQNEKTTLNEITRFHNKKKKIEKKSGNREGGYHPVKKYNSLKDKSKKVSKL